MKDNIYFTKKNYILLVAGLLVCIIGYALMAGGNPENPNEYSEDIFSFRRITLAPIVILSGYIIVLLGIITNFKDNSLDSVLEEPVSKKK